jgi:hypothetical protein
MCAFSEINTGWVLIVTILTVVVMGFLFIAAPKLSTKKGKEAETKAEAKQESVEMVSERKPMMTNEEAPETDRQSSRREKKVNPLLNESHDSANAGRPHSSASDIGEDELSKSVVNKVNK